MARRGSSPYLQYAVVGGLSYFGYQWAEQQPPGSAARNAADQIKGLLSSLTTGTRPITATAGPVTDPGFAARAAASLAQAAAAGNPPATQPANNSGVPPGTVFGPPSPSPSSSSGMWLTFGLTDLNGFPLVFDPNQAALVQDPSQGGTNVYGPNDAFIDSTGNIWIIAGLGLDAQVVQDSGGGTGQLSDFVEVPGRVVSG